MKQKSARWCLNLPCNLTECSNLIICHLNEKDTLKHKTETLIGCLASYMANIRWTTDHT